MTIQGLHRGGGWRECAEVGSLLTWRVNALWGPGMGSFSAGAGTDKHTASFSAVRAAGDCKSRNVSEPRPSTVGQRQVKVSHPVARPGLFPRHFRLLCEGESADECYKDPHFPDELTPGNCSRTLNGLRTDVGGLHVYANCSHTDQAHSGIHGLSYHTRARADSGTELVRWAGGDCMGLLASPGQTETQA